MRIFVVPIVLLVIGGSFTHGHFGHFHHDDDHVMNDDEEFGNSHNNFFSGTVGHHHAFEKSCTKHEDCKGKFPEEWCHGKGSDGGKKCVIMPPIKQTCEKDSDCPTKGNVCYSKRCVEPARFEGFFNDFPRADLFSDIPPIQNCTASIECKNFPREWCINNHCVWKPPGRFHANPDLCTVMQMCKPGDICKFGRCVLPPRRPVHQHEDIAVFEKSCTKHEDCKGKIPEEWCHGKGNDGGKNCVIMPPIKQTCEKDSDCPTKGNVCYSKRCVEPARFEGFFNDFPRADLFSDIPPIQNCTASIECKNFPREWCINNHCVWKPPGRFHANPDLCTVMQMCKPGDICKFGRCVLPPRRPVHQHEDIAVFEKSCTKHEDCKGKIPEEWCHGKGNDGGKNCVIMPPIKQTCEKDSDCPTKGNVCYSKRCVEPARFEGFFNDFPRADLFSDIPPIQNCTASIECKNFPREWCINNHCVWKPPGRFHANPDLCTVMQMCKPGDICKFGRCVLPPRRPVHQHEDIAVFEKSCTKHEDCKGKIPEEWCHGKGNDGGKNCVIMPPIKQTCEKDSDCPTKGNVCYSKRCVEPARFEGFFNDFPRADLFSDIPPIQNCTASIECKNFPREWCINNHCVWKPPGRFHANPDLCTVMQMCKPGDICKFGRCVLPPRRPVHQHEDIAVFEKSCTKHEDCKGKIPEEWCHGKGNDGGKKCVIMPPIKQTCEKDSDCPTKGNVCYSKRCVEPAHFVGYFNDFPRENIFSDIPPIQNCTASIECKNFPREWCINNHCVWKPPGRFHANPDLCTVMQMCKPGDICKFGRCVLPPRRPVHQHEDFAAFEKSCTKHEDCKGKIPEEWCHGKGSDGGKKCVIMPPIKQTCEKDSDCPTNGNVCYSKRCVEPAFSIMNFSEAVFGNREDDFGNLGDRGYPRNFIPGRRPCTETADCGPIQTCIRGFCKEQY